MIIIYVPRIDMQALESLVFSLLYAFFSHMLVVCFSLLLLNLSKFISRPTKPTKSNLTFLMSGRGNLTPFVR